MKREVTSALSPRRGRTRERDPGPRSPRGRSGRSPAAVKTDVPEQRRGASPHQSAAADRHADAPERAVSPPQPREGERDSGRRSDDRAASSTAAAVKDDPDHSQIQERDIDVAESSPQRSRGTVAEETSPQRSARSHGRASQSPAASGGQPRDRSPARSQDSLAQVCSDNYSGSTKTCLRRCAFVRIFSAPEEGWMRSTGSIISVSMRMGLCCNLRPVPSQSFHQYLRRGAQDQERMQRSGSYSQAASPSPSPEPEPEPEPPLNPYEGFVSCYPLLLSALMARRPAKARPLIGRGFMDQVSIRSNSWVESDSWSIVIMPKQ